jgi:hypothetical protein
VPIVDAANPADRRNVQMTAANPTFTDIVNLLNILYNNDPDINDAPHGAFWQNTTRDNFIKIKTDAWGVPGALVTLNDPNKSNLYRALAGLPPFDGSQLPQMPDTTQTGDPNARHATPDELTMVANWITHNATA